jgi:vacuolar-type H+-ATPase subunit E/Vma4
VSLEAILEAIETDGLARVREIERRAQEEVEEILAAAQADAERLRQEACAAEAAPAALECARIIQGARLEGLRVVGEEREALVETALQQARGRLSKVRGDRAYSRALRQLVEEALDGLGRSAGESRGASLEVDPRDREAVESILRALGAGVAVRYDLDCMGGVIARSEDGRVNVLNTLEARLTRAEPFLRRSLGALFEEGQSESKARRVKFAAEA